MKNIIILIIALVAITMLVRCSCDEGYHIEDWSWKEEKPVPITWEKLDTFVSEAYGFKVEYPSTFVADTTDREVDFLHVVDGELIFMRCYSMQNSDGWDEQTAADSIADIRREVIGDSVVMKDMHPGYFYLKGYDEERGLGFYEQYVMDRGLIYTYELCYPKNLENRMQRLMDLVHNWNP